MTPLEQFTTTSNGQYTGNNFGYLYGGSRMAVLDYTDRQGVRRRKPDILDETDYKRREDKWRIPYGHFRKEHVWYPGQSHIENGYGDFGQHTINEAKQTNDTLSTNLKNLATQRALSKLDRMDMDFGTAFAESGKTARMVGDLATTSVKALNAIHKRDVRKLLEVLGLSKPKMRGKGVVDAYLTYHYGINPALQDVAGATSALTRLPPEAFRVLVRGKATRESIRTKPVNLATDWKYTARSVLNEGCRVKISAIPRPLSREDDIRWSLGLDNFGLTQAWELTPFSFVLDWALPIGEYLRALTTLKYYTGWQVCTSSYHKEDVQFSGWAGSTEANWNYVSTAKGSWNQLWLERKVSVGPPLYGLPYKDPRSMDHMAKALALLASTLASRGNPPRTFRI